MPPALKDCQFLREDPKYVNRLLKMFWLSVLVHVIVFAVGFWLAPYFRTVPEPEMPPLFQKEGGQLPDTPDHPFPLNGAHSFGAPPALGIRNSSLLPVVKETAPGGGMVCIQETFVSKAWTIDERLEWIERVVFETVRRIDVLWRRLFAGYALIVNPRN